MRDRETINKVITRKEEGARVNSPFINADNIIKKKICSNLIQIDFVL